MSYWSMAVSGPQQFTGRDCERKEGREFPPVEQLMSPKIHEHFHFLSAATVPLHNIKGNCFSNKNSSLQTDLQGTGNFEGPQKPWVMILFGCLAQFNPLTCELQHCTHWKKKRRCLCHKHGILHLDILEGILQWILDLLSSQPWHHSQSEVCLWEQNLGKVRLNVFIAEWSCHKRMSNWMKGMPSSYALTPMLLRYKKCLCPLHLQYNT